MSQRVYRSDQNSYLPIYYTKVWYQIFKKSMSKSMAYRFEYLSKFVRMLLVLFIQLVLVNSLYSQTDFIEGWSIEDYYLLLGIYNFINYMSWGLFNVNLWRIEERVVKGEFDFLLLYPSGSIFSASFNEFFLDDAISSISGLILIIYYFANHWNEITFVAFVGFLLVVIFGMVIWYSIHLGAAAMNFISVRNGFMNLTKGLTRTASFPIDIFGTYLRFFMYTIFPVAFIAAVPVRVLTGVFSWEFVLFAGVAAIVSLFVARGVWRFSLRSYTSAGG